MKNHLKVVSIFVMFFILAGCIFLPENSSLAPTIQVSTLTLTVKPTATFTPQPTSTKTPIPTATPSLWNTKTVLAQFGIFGGDGGWDHYAFIGRDMPKWILYTDGQFIVQKEDSRGVWFEETVLSNSQMCSFLSQIENTGFYTLAFDDSSALQAGIPTANPIYNFDNTTQFSEGGPYYILQVNGSKHRLLNIYSQYIQYLVPDAKKVFNFFDNYSPPSNLTKYRAQYLLLRVEEGLGYSIYSTPAPNTQNWSNDLPSLEKLREENIKTEASAYLSGGVSQVLITDEMVEPISNAFDNRLAYKLFQSEGKVYYVVARPLLPHETINDFSGFPQEAEFELPFSCNN